MKFIMICLFFIAVFYPISGQAKDFSLSQLQEWVDKCPTAKIHGKSAWETGGLIKRIQNLLGKKRFSYFQKNLQDGAQSPIIANNNVILIDNCKRHDCLSNRIGVYVDLSTNDVNICLRSSDLNEILWFSPNKAPRQMPDDGCLHNEDFKEYNSYK